MSKIQILLAHNEAIRFVSFGKEKVGKKGKKCAVREFKMIRNTPPNRPEALVH